MHYASQFCITNIHVVLTLYLVTNLTSLANSLLHLFMSLKNVTVYGKTRHMRFFVKVEFDASMISSTIELTRVQVLDRSCASLWRYSALFAIAPHPQ